ASRCQCAYTDFIVRRSEQSEDDMADPLWPHVHLLTVIAQAGSFTQAAQRLALSKAAVSQRIADLERAVGLTLVQRTTRSVRLTDAGQRLVDDCSVALAQLACRLVVLSDM